MIGKIVDLGNWKLRAQADWASMFQVYTLSFLISAVVLHAQILGAIK